MREATDFSKFNFKSESIFDSLPAADLLDFKKCLKLKKVRKGRLLFQEGTYPRGVFILKRGKVKIFQESPGGVEQIVYIYVPGDMFGYRPILSNERHSASAMSIEECGIYFLTPDSFTATLKKSAAFSNVLLRNLSNEFSVLVNRIAAFGQKSVKERVALSLLILSEKYKKSDRDKHVEILLSRSDLAAFAGTTIETVARVISKMKQDRMITTAGRKITIANSKALFDMMD